MKGIEKVLNEYWLVIVAGLLIAVAVWWYLEREGVVDIIPDGDEDGPIGSNAPQVGPVVLPAGLTEMLHLDLTATEGG